MKTFCSIHKRIETFSSIPLSFYGTAGEERPRCKVCENLRYVKWHRSEAKKLETSIPSLSIKHLEVANEYEEADKSNK